ncbi:MAG TPA: SAM-dependent methyltransferase, partial [Pyrinomonadaceae bacterium]|nr:SAM-dependent methyltransferase [Pyrinomonadaceae bacterium]
IEVVPQPSVLSEQLRERIKREGPITFCEWMRTALYHDPEGYYRKPQRTIWGRAGDYRTSPERSELFAATFARYFTRLYDEVERPADWTIAECGAGNGEFAACVLGVLKDRFPQVFAATQYAICELSDDARRRAEERLSEFGDRVQFSADLPHVNSGLFFSNELLDAFPVHRVVKDQGELFELYVTLGPAGFEWSSGPLSTERLSEFCAQYSVELAPGQIIEINVAIEDWLKKVAGKLERGFVVTVDYGAEAVDLYDPVQRPEGTLRGFRRHNFVTDVLAEPGECDITTSVNWTQVRRVGERLGLEVVEFASQDKFLLNAGLLDELELRLGKTGRDAEKLSLSTGAREMILPGGMASSFQVLVLQTIRRLHR